MEWSFSNRLKEIDRLESLRSSWVLQYGQNDTYGQLFRPIPMTQQGLLRTLNFYDEFHKYAKLALQQLTSSLENGISGTKNL